MRSFFKNLNYARGLFRLWLILLCPYFLVSSYHYYYEVKEIYRYKVSLNILGNNSRDFYSFAPDFYLYSNDIKNACITLGKKFDRLLFIQGVSREQSKDNVWFSPGTTNYPRYEGNFMYFAEKEGPKSWSSGSWSSGGKFEEAADNDFLKELFFDKLKPDWEKCRNFYNWYIYADFWKEVFLVILMVLSLPLLPLIVGFILIKFKFWPFSWIYENIKRLGAWVITGFKD